ncbi:MAG: hypothetical protein KKD64_15385 [Alphaproteobacteria bacterium]|nr:hypothetical protein [Alphaproteobacteria bacterium]MBU0876130.1 hypothetical protein [Alphaproteobacteria bacterium]MBU1771021.1 hypothetical protein [Alphaproteobacteria bacterium]
MDEPTDPAESAHAALIGEVKKPGSLALLFMATSLSVISIFNLPDIKIPVVWLVTLLILWLTYIWISTAALRTQATRISSQISRIALLESQSNLQLPKVIRAMKDPYSDTEILLLLRPNQLFGQSMLVSIYFEDERGLELLVGDGSVGNIQTNGLIQISVNRWQEAHDDVRQKIIEQNQSTIERLMVKPASNTSNNQQNEINAALLNALLARATEEAEQ